MVRGLILAEIVYKILKSVISKCDFQKLQNSVVNTFVLMVVFGSLYSDKVYDYS